MLMIIEGVCACNYEEDEKNQKILVGYGSLAETSVLFTKTPISSQHDEQRQASSISLLQHQYSPKRITSLTTFLLDAPLRYVMSLQIHTRLKPIDLEDEVKADLTQLTRVKVSFLCSTVTKL